MTAIFIAYQSDDQNRPVGGKVLLCERLDAIGCIRAFVINGKFFTMFDRSGNGIDEHSYGTKIMWSGTRPDHIKGYNEIIDWFMKTVLPGLIPSDQSRSQEPALRQASSS